MPEAAITEPEVTTPEPDGGAPPVTPPDVTTPDAAEPAGEGDFLTYWKDRYGEDLSGQFNDPEAFVDSLREARKLAGVRSDAAKRWDQVAPYIQGREQDFVAWATGRAAAQQPAAPEPLPSPQEMRAWALAIEAGKATPDIQGKYQRAQEAMLNAMHAWAADPLSQIKAALAKEGIDLGALRAMPQVAQQMQAKTLEDAIRAKEHAYRDLLFDDKSEYTPLCRGAMELCADQAWCRDLPYGPDRVEQAIITQMARMGMASKPAPKQRAVNPAARRQPGTAPPTTSPMTLEDFFAKPENRGPNGLELWGQYCAKHGISPNPET